MRLVIPTLVFVWLSLTPRLLAQPTYPAEMTITVPEVEARSGPTTMYYATSKLHQGERVLVLRVSQKEPGWLAIRPPQGSFSWIEAKHVKQVPGNSRIGYVETEGNIPVPVRPGSSLDKRPPNMESVKIPSGSIVVIVDSAQRGEDGTTWLPIQPPPTEERYIPAEAVQARALAANPQHFAPAQYSANPLIAKADQALQAGQVEQALQLYRDAAERTSSIQEKAHCYNRLASLTKSTWSPGHPQLAQGSTGVKTIGQTASLTSQPQTLTYTPRWSQYGILRRAAFPQDGQPVFVLENRQGGVLLYAVCPPGTSLSDYVGRTVALYGPLTYRSDAYVRTHIMTVSHIAAP
ncbi:MAG: hypothetical protein L0Y70_22870 [Gemmataceae bacterium]|nr:hypothetical protein [Gemmataceae bacterium]